MSFDMFLNLDGIKGESADKTKKEDVDVLSYSWGMSQSGTAGTSKGQTSGKVHVQDISFTKYVDKATPNLMQFCCKGASIKKAVLTIRKAGGDTPVDYLTITFEEAIVSSISTGGSESGDRLSETITLNFAKFKVKYQGQDAGNLPAGAVERGWDIAQNCAV